MNNLPLKGIYHASIVSAMLFTSIANAAPVTIDITATIQDVSGTYLSSLSASQSLSGTFTYDTDEANASSANTTGSTVPGHEFTSFYDFSGSPYDVRISGSGFNFDNEAPVGVVMNNNLSLSADDTGGILPAGTYDWIEILGSTASDISGPNTPGNGQEWTLAFFADDANWFTDGSIIPDDMPASYTALLVGIDLDASGDEIGLVFATVDSVTVSSVPVPAAVWLFASGLIGLAGIAKQKRTTINT